LAVALIVLTIKLFAISLLLSPGGGVGDTRSLPKVEVRATPQGLDQMSKMEEVLPKMTRRRGSDADNPGGELDPAADVRRRCRNSPSVSSCTDKRTREGYELGSKVGTVHIGQDGERPVPPRKPKESGQKRKL